MMRRFETSAQPKKGLEKKERPFRGIPAADPPLFSCRRRVSDRVALLGLAIGYLGMVAVLASVPAWSKISSSYPPSSLACSDFGGSR